MRKKDFLILLFVFSLFFVDIVPLNINLMNSELTLSLGNITTYVYTALGLYVLYHVLNYFKATGISNKLINMYLFGFLVSLFLALKTLNVHLFNQVVGSNEVFILFFGRGNPNSALAVFFVVIFNLLFLAINLGIYYLVAYPVYELMNKVKVEILFYKYLNIVFISFVFSKSLYIFLEFFINIFSLDLQLTHGITFLLFISWLLNIIAIASLIAFKIIIIVNIYNKATNKK